MSHQETAPGHQAASLNSGVVVPGAIRDHARSSRAMLFALLAVIIAITGIAIVLQVFVAQRIPELTEERLEAALELWEQQGPRSYDLDLEIRGAQPGTVHIEIRGGEVTAMTRDGRSPPRRTWDVWSVPGQFDTLERELVLAEDPQHEMGAAAGTQLQLRAEFDAEFGYPRRYHRYATGGAPEVFWRVTAFDPI
ncbi:MAG: DUF6174 domain-containing protein [Pirellulales bacterium]